MLLQKLRRPAAIFLAVLGLTLSACGTGGTPEDTAPTADAPSSPTQEARSDASPGPSQSGEPAPSQSPSPSPTQSGDPAPSRSPSPSPTQSDDPAPPQSPSPSPSQSGDPAPSQSPSPSPSQGGDPPPSQSPDPLPPPVETSSGVVQEGADVGNDWFADAVFLGDSRTDGLRLYSGIKGTTFICHTGLSVFTVGSNACIKSDEGKITAMEALAKQQYAKVYLMLGVNELGYSTETFQRAYTEVVEQIKTLQPAATIYLQTLIPVNEPIAYEHGTNRAINNEKLKQFNQVIASIAQSENVCLVDVDTPFWTAEGCLAAENTGDGVHLTRSGYQAWFAYLRTHTAGAGPAAPVPEEGGLVYIPPASDPTYMPPESGPGQDPWDESLPNPGGQSSD